MRSAPLRPSLSKRQTTPAAPSTAFAGPDVGPTAFPLLALKPSVEDARIVEEIDLGARLPFAGSPDMDQSTRLTGSLKFMYMTTVPT
jgi:hypothetical protein